MEIIDLLALSDEILLNIFRNLNEINLLNVAQVCKKFNVAAKRAIAAKYDGSSKDKCYNVWILPGSEISNIHRKFFETFGDQVSPVHLRSNHRQSNIKMIKLINRHCRQAKYVTISGTSSYYFFSVTKAIRGFSNLISLTLQDLSCTEFFWADERRPQLETLYIDAVKNIDVQVLKHILRINPQLKHLKVTNCSTFPVQVLQPLRNHLNGLKSLEYDTSSTWTIWKL